MIFLRIAQECVFVHLQCAVGSFLFPAVANFTEYSEFIVGYTECSGAGTPAKQHFGKKLIAPG
jgi:hypothetical protein